MSKTGEVLDTKIVKSLGHAGCDQAAVDALKSVKWEPAKQDGKPVRVWISIPILFKLPGEETAGLRPPPAPPNNNTFEFQTSSTNSEFQAFDTPPKPVGGFKAIQENLKYPETARAAGIEGKVFVRVKIDEAGKVGGTQVVKSSGHEALDKSAIEAIRLTKWHPGQKEGQAVKVEISIPVHFRLGEQKAQSMPPPAPKDGN